MSEGEPRRKRRPGMAVAVSCAATALAVAHVIWPGLAIDSITVMLLLVAVIPWLGGVFDSIEIPGGPRFEFRRLENRIEAAEERTTRLDQEMNDAAATARVALAAAGSDWAGERADLAAAQAAMERLAAEYTRLRQEMAGSPARTTQQERIFAELLRATSSLPSLDVQAMLASPDPGTRLAALARLYALPDAALFGPLVDAVESEQLPFLRYWALNVLGRAVDDLGSDQVPLSVVRRLHALLPQVPAGSDRARSLRRVLAKLATD